MDRLERLATADRCPKCEHPLEIHALNVLGKTTCVMCKSGECTEVDVTTKDTPASLGFSLIGEMSKRDLIDEIVIAQRKALTSASMDDLKVFVVQLRAKAVHERLMQEAAINPRGYWPMGES